jgi:hypothetical protein
MLSLLVALAGCSELDDFRTKPGEVFHGQVIGSDSSENEPSFIREGFASRTEMELKFDPGLAASYLDAGASEPGVAQSPGTIDTFSCSVDRAVCPKSQRRQEDLDHAPLEVIAHLTHDPLSRFDFPGGGRLRNYMFGARFRTSAGTKTLQRYAMVFLSLMEDGKIEARVIAPSVVDDDGHSALAPAMFGVFTLERRKL